MIAVNRRVVCAAIRHRTTQRLICGPRHVHCFESIDEDDAPKYEQGFVDQSNVFMTRKEAWAVAKAQKQLNNLCGDSEGRGLLSEDLY